MRGALKITYNDGTDEYFEVDPAGDSPTLASDLQTFLASPHVTLVLDNEFLIIPSTSIRHISITRTNTQLPLEELEAIPGVLVGATRIVG